MSSWICRRWTTSRATRCKADHDAGRSPRDPRGGRRHRRAAARRARTPRSRPRRRPGTPRTGAPHTDTYLRAADRATLERVTRGLAIPTDHRFAYEPRGVPSRMAHLLHRRRPGALTGSRRSPARARSSSRRPSAPRSRSISTRWARSSSWLPSPRPTSARSSVFLLDDRVESAPVINSAIRVAVTSGSRSRAPATPRARGARCREPRDRAGERGRCRRRSSSVGYITRF